MGFEALSQLKPHRRIAHQHPSNDALMAEAKKNGWTVISMKDDWKVIFPFEIK